MLADFFRYLASEWAVISQAPLSFILGLLLASGLIWWLVDWVYATRIKSKDAVIERLNANAKAPRVEPNRLSVLKKHLRNHALEADKMYEQIEATQSLSEAERNERLRVFVAPDVRRWHTDVKALIERELGEAKANEFARGNWSTDLDFLLRFIRRKKKHILDLASITETDLE